MRIEFDTTMPTIWRDKPEPLKGELIKKFNRCVTLTMDAMRTYAAQQQDTIITFDPKEEPHPAGFFNHLVGGEPGDIECLKIGNTIQLVYPDQYGRPSFKVPFIDVDMLKIGSPQALFELEKTTEEKYPDTGSRFRCQLMENPHSRLTKVPLTLSHGPWGLLLKKTFNQASLRSVMGLDTTLQELIALGLDFPNNCLADLKI